jgi:hypothetical protein
VIAQFQGLSEDRRSFQRSVIASLRAATRRVEQMRRLPSVFCHPERSEGSGS